MRNEKEIRFVDIFGGVGGFRIGLENAGADSRNHNGPRFRCVGYAEINKYSTQVYNRNFKEAHKPTDVATTDSSDIPDHDLFCAGFPCQSFSLAGRRKGFGDTRGTMFFEICRIIKKKKPGLVFLENVKGLLSHDGGETFRVILDSLDELGYDAEWQVLNSKDFGVPQNRERVFIIGHLRDQKGCTKEVFPIRQSEDIYPDKRGSQQKEEAGVRREDIASTISSRYGALRNSGETYIQESGNALKQVGQVGEHDDMGQRIYDPSGISVTIRAEGGGQGAKTEPYAIPCLTPTRPSIRQQGRRLKENGDPMFTLTGQDVHGILTESEIRRLTPKECERLQGFPDDWTKNGTEGEISDTQRYKMMGNAVTTNVIEAIGRKIIRTR